MLWFKFILIYILLLLYNIEAKPTLIDCPKSCVCDVHFALKRATCQNKTLVSIELDMPQQVEILDVSCNLIKEFRKNIFVELGMTNLKLLNVSHNKLSQIHFESFEGLSFLKTLDLSFNMLRYLLENWWLSLSNLEELYLAGNLLRDINSEPIKLGNLKVLDLSNCAIDNFRADVFERLPNLQVLDISKNNLIHLKIEVLKPLRLLNHLNLQSNPFECTQYFSTEIKKLKRHIDRVEVEETCLKNKHIQKFERMVMMNQPPHQQNGWLLDEDIETVDNDTVITCTEEKSVNKTDNLYVHHLMRVVELSPPLFVVFLFVFGFAMGVLFGCTCQIQGKTRHPNTQKLDDDEVFVENPTYWVHDKNTMKDKRKSVSSNNSYRRRSKSAGSKFVVREDRNLLVINEHKLSDSTPMLPRKWTANDFE